MGLRPVTAALKAAQHPVCATDNRTPVLYGLLVASLRLLVHGHNKSVVSPVDVEGCAIAVTRAGRMGQVANQTKHLVIWENRFDGNGPRSTLKFSMALS